MLRPDLKVGILILCIVFPGGAFFSAPAAVAGDPDSVRIARERQVDILLFDAETYLEEKNYAVAIPVLEKVLELDPDRVDIWERLAQAYQFWVASLPDPPDDVVSRAVLIYRAILERESGNRFALTGLKELGARYAGPVLPTLRDKGAQEAWKAGETEFARQMKNPVASRDLTQAADSYREALRREPRHPGMFVKLAGILVLSDPGSAEARSLYGQALEINPADLVALNGLASLDIAAGRFEAAGLLLEAALEIEDMDPPGSVKPEAGATRERLGIVLDKLGETAPTARRHFYLGRLHLAEGNDAEAAKALQTAADLDTTAIAYRKYLGIAMFNLERFNESLGYFQAVLQKDPADPDALFHIGAMLFDLNHFEPAVQHLRPVVDVARYRGRAARLLGLALTRVDQHSETSALYLEQAIREGSTDPQIRCILGEQYLRLERWDDARTRFGECLKAMPNHPAGLLGSGLIADHDKKYEKAVTLLEEFLTKHPDSPAVLMRLGLSYLKLGRTDTAVERFRTAIGSDTTLAEVKAKDLSSDQILELGFLILMAGRNYEDGIVIGEHLATTAPDNPGYANNLAMAYADADKRLDRALELSERANRKSPDNAGFLDTLGWTYVRLKRFKDARKTLERAIELAQAEPAADASEIYYHMAYLLAEMNQNEEAIEYVQKTLEKPGNPLIEDSARKLLAKLQEK